MSGASLKIVDSGMSSLYPDILQALLCNFEAHFLEIHLLVVVCADTHDSPD